MRTIAWIVVATVLPALVCSSFRNWSLFGDRGYTQFQPEEQENQTLRTSIKNALDGRFEDQTAPLVMEIEVNRLPQIARFLKSKGLNMAYIRRHLNEGAVSKIEAAVLLAAVRVMPELQRVAPALFGTVPRRNSLLEFISAEWLLDRKEASSTDSVQTSMMSKSGSGDRLRRISGESSSLSPMHIHSSPTSAPSKRVMFEEFWFLPNRDEANVHLAAIVAQESRPDMVAVARQTLGREETYSLERLTKIWRYVALRIVQKRLEIISFGMPLLQAYVDCVTDAHEQRDMLSALQDAAVALNSNPEDVSMAPFERIGRIAMHVHSQVFYDILSLQHAVDRRNHQQEFEECDMLILYIVEELADVQSVKERLSKKSYT